MKKIIIFIVFIFLVGCYITTPKKFDKEPDACFYYRSCMYSNQSNPDKTICRDALKECLNYIRFEYCKDNRPADIKFTECWNMLQ